MEALIRLVTVASILLFCLFTACAKKKSEAETITTQSQKLCSLDGYSYEETTVLTDIEFSGKEIFIAGYQCQQGNTTWLLKSTNNGGLSFNNLLHEKTNGKVIELLKEKSGRIFAIGDVDAGWRIDQIGGPSQLLELKRSTLNGAALIDGTIYAFGSSENTDDQITSKVYRSDNFGASWSIELEQQSSTQYIKLKQGPKADLYLIANNQSGSTETRLLKRSDDGWELLHKFQLSEGADTAGKDMAFDSAGRVWIVGNYVSVINGASFQASFVRRVDSDGIAHKDIETFAYSLDPPRTASISIHIDSKDQVRYMLRGFSNRQAQKNNLVKTEKLNWLIRVSERGKTFSTEDSYQFRFGNNSYPKGLHSTDDGKLFSFGSEHLPSQNGNIIYKSTRAVIRIRSKEKWRNLLTYY